MTVRFTAESPEGTPFFLSSHPSKNLASNHQHALNSPTDSPEEPEGLSPSFAFDPHDTDLRNLAAHLDHSLRHLGVTIVPRQRGTAGLRSNARLHKPTVPLIGPLAVESDMSYHDLWSICRLGGLSMTTGSDFHPQYVTDPEGRKTAVILPIEEYHELLEDLADLAVVGERRNEPTVPHDKVVTELRKDGPLSD